MFAQYDVLKNRIYFMTSMLPLHYEKSQGCFRGSWCDFSKIFLSHNFFAEEARKSCLETTLIATPTCLHNEIIVNIVNLGQMNF